MIVSSCPKCGKKLHLFNVSQFCPACGVNMRFVKFEEDFYREAKIAELSQAAMGVKIKRFKASFVGSKLTYLRIALMFLPVFTLLIPHGGFTLTLPYKETAISFGALGLYQLFGGGDLGYLTQMSASDLAGGAFSALVTALYAYLAVAVCAVLVLLLSIFCFISIKNMQKILAVVASLGVVASVAAIALIARFVSVAGSSPLLRAENGFGLYVTILLFAAVIVNNVLLIRHPVPVEYSEGAVERAAMWKRVRSGEVKIDDLPQPVVVTEATKKIDEEIAKEEATYEEKLAQREAEKNA